MRRIRWPCEFAWAWLFTRLVKNRSRPLATRAGYSFGVHESQVSLDERNEYHGIILDRATKILEALNARLVIQVESAPTKENHQQSP